MFKFIKYPPRTVKSKLHVVTVEEYQKLPTNYDILPSKRFAETNDTDEVIVAQPEVSVEIATRLVNL